MIDALDIVAFVQRRVAVFNLQVRGIADPFQDFKYRVSLGKAHRGLGENGAVLGHEGGLFLVQVIGIVQDGIADDGNGTSVRLPFFYQGIVFELCNFVLAAQAAAGVGFQQKRRGHTGNGNDRNDENHNQVRGFLFHTDPLFMSSVPFIKDSIVDFTSCSKSFLLYFSGSSKVMKPVILRWAISEGA